MDGLDKRDNEKEIKRLRHERNFYDKQYQEWAETAELYAKKIDKLRDDNRKLRGKIKDVDEFISRYKRFGWCKTTRVQLEYIIKKEG